MKRTLLLCALTSIAAVTQAHEPTPVDVCADNRVRHAIETYNLLTFGNPIPFSAVGSPKTGVQIKAMAPYCEDGQDPWVYPCFEPQTTAENIIKMLFEADLDGYIQKAIADKSEIEQLIYLMDVKDTEIKQHNQNHSVHNISGLGLSTEDRVKVKKRDDLRKEYTILKAKLFELYDQEKADQGCS